MDYFFNLLITITKSFINKRIDGIWGKYTEKAANQFINKSETIEERVGTFDRRTEKHIQSLALNAQTEARHFMARLLDNGIDAKIISGTRTYEEQNKLYRQGRYGSPIKIVNNGGAR